MIINFAMTTYIDLCVNNKLQMVYTNERITCDNNITNYSLSDQNKIISNIIEEYIINNYYGSMDELVSYMKKNNISNDYLGLVCTYSFDDVTRDVIEFDALIKSVNRESVYDNMHGFIGISGYSGFSGVSGCSGKPSLKGPTISSNNISTSGWTGYS